jgi:hypothetical protein
VDSREAKEILACYRRDLESEADPRVAEALALAQRDPELARWLENQSAFDAAVREQFQRIPVPPDLRGEILARLASSPRDTVRWRWPSARAAAAGLAALALVAGIWIVERRAAFDAYRQEMVGLVSGDYEINFKSSRFEEIRDYLASRGSPSDYSLTPAMRELEAEGVSVVQWRGRKVSLICLDAGEDQDLFLFVVDRAVFRDAPAMESPQFARVGAMTTAAWSAGDKVYFFAGRGDERFLRQHL